MTAKNLLWIGSIATALALPGSSYAQDELQNPASNDVQQQSQKKPQAAKQNLQQQNSQQQSQARAQNAQPPVVLLGDWNYDTDVLGGAGARSG